MQRPDLIGILRGILDRWLPDRARRAALRFLGGERKSSAIIRRAAKRFELGSMPLLTVVMPVYNVEEFVAEAIESVLAQTYTNIELILVDDGSTDSSPAICDAYARANKSISVLHQTNGGLGNARNVGAKLANGKYLVFIDSDDLLYPNSYEVMVRSLESSGSDLVTGNVERFTSVRRWQSWNQKTSHAVSRQAIRMEESPELVYDTTAWNKMFRLDFYRRIDIFFPERKLYEDMVPMLNAMLEASTLDIVANHVYLWRQRDGQNSITQRRSEYVNLRDKVEMMHLGYDLLVAKHHPEMVELFFKKAFGGDLVAYIRHVDAGDPEFDEQFDQAVRWFWPLQSETAIEHLKLEHRVFYAAVMDHNLAIAKQYWDWCRLHVTELPTRVDGDKIFVDVTLAAIDLPPIRELAWQLVDESRIDSCITSVVWVGDRLKVAGWAYIPEDDRSAEQEISIKAVASDGTRAQLAVTKTTSDEAMIAAKSTIRSYDNTGFEAWLSADDLPAGLGSYELEATVTREGLSRTGPITTLRRTGSIRALTAGRIAGSRKVQPVHRLGRPLQLNVLPSMAAAESAVLEGRTVRAHLTLDPAVTVVSAWIENDKGLVKRPVDFASTGPHSWQFDAKVPDVASAKTINWYLVADLANGSSCRVDIEPGARLDSSTGADALWLDRSPAGHTVVVQRPRVAEVESISIVDDLRIRLRGSVAEPVEFAISSLNSAPTDWVAAAHDGRSFDVEFDLGGEARDGVRRPVVSDRYVIHVRSADQQEHAESADVWSVRASTLCAANMPAFSQQPLANIEVYLTTARKLRVLVGPPLTVQERSKFGQAQLALEARKQGALAPENAVFMTTYFGFEAADSPRAIHVELGKREPDMTRYWGVIDHSVVLPDGAVAVIKNSAAWFRAIAASTYLFNNVGSIYKGYERLPHQIDVQTWHGTPLKIVGRSLKIDEGKSHQEMDREGKEWDYLVSQSPFNSEVVSADLATDAKILETGYPRNDELFTTSVERIAAIKRELGISGDAKVLLYAPTWRDNTKAGFTAPLFEALDLDALSAALGPDWVVLLRGHGFNARVNDGSRSRNAVIDVTKHHSINELYLVADSLVTDYSSVMFDYCNLNRPILFYVPDYDSYMSMRRTYFDLRATAPGPVLDTQAELHEALTRLDSFENDFGDRYAEFKQRFAPWDDGGAAGRVIDAVIGRPKPIKY